MRLGLFLFLILINFAGYQDLEKELGEHMTVTKTKRQIIPKIHLKFVDDLTLAEAFNIKDYVIPNPDPNPPAPWPTMIGPSMWCLQTGPLYKMSS